MSERRSFLKENRAFFWVCPFFLAMIAVITILYDVNIEYGFYIAGFYLVFWFFAMGMQYKAFKERRAKEAERNNLPDSGDQMKWQKYQEEEDFFVLWTHQIKTPISALNVLLQAKDISAIACRQELIKIEGYVEMALGYTRYENMGNDMILQNCDLEAIVKGVVKKYSTIFIYKHLAIKLEQLNYQVLTDEKWLSFVLEQVLSNALKYTMRGEICISGEECWDGLRIVVSDTGIGIKEEDMPRIFEKGFTGYNGRMDKKASGLGLYLCREICRKLGHSIAVESKVNEGTKVTILMQYEKVNQADLTKM